MIDYDNITPIFFVQLNFKWTRNLARLKPAPQPNEPWRGLLGSYDPVLGGGPLVVKATGTEEILLRRAAIDDLL